ncbi:DUF397 domain-containing protein [Streptomyces sp. NBC_01525]|uniref:DUF397 domain-containing protein n=1 Tax=Streptomyces benahoarensis TaxID=2595054 RepID=A0A553ZFN4_9ACTN|nr:DUF397 domain-containing protein [Streptomyces benahoarensis]TSB26651.1 DUF397 domain-containing protein [Streptomyces benahoarensis]TSB40227.1 DUF397 domain-containing protein [Streptomyces benahoarensis]
MGSADLTGTAYAAVAVRDAKAPQGPAMVFPAGGWASSVSTVKRGELSA